MLQLEVSVWTKLPNETVEKPIAQKISTKTSHRGLKNGINSRQNAAENTKTWCFSIFSPTLKQAVYEKGLFRQFQRLALAAWGGSVDNAVETEKLKATQNA